MKSKLYRISLSLWLLAFVPAFQAQNTEITLSLQLLVFDQYIVYKVTGINRRSKSNCSLSEFKSRSELNYWTGPSV